MKSFEIAYTFIDCGGTYHCISYGKNRDDAIRNFYKEGFGLHVHFLDCEEITLTSL